MYVSLYVSLCNSVCLCMGHHVSVCHRMYDLVSLYIIVLNVASSCHSYVKVATCGFVQLG